VFSTDFNCFWLLRPQVWCHSSLLMCLTRDSFYYLHTALLISDFHLAVCSCWTIPALICVFTRVFKACFFLSPPLQESKSLKGKDASKDCEIQLLLQFLSLLQHLSGFSGIVKKFCMCCMIKQLLLQVLPIFAFVIAIVMSGCDWRRQTRSLFWSKHSCH